MICILNLLIYCLVMPTSKDEAIHRKIQWSDTFAFFAMENPTDALNHQATKMQSLQVDWLVHMGGPLRGRIDESARVDRPVLVLTMEPDPVVTFEVKEWLASGLREQDVEFHVALPEPRFREHWRNELMSIKGIRLHETGVAGENWFSDSALWRTRLIGPSLSPWEADTAVTDFVRQVPANGQPPWLYWSYLAPWLRVHHPGIDLTKFEKRMSCLRALLSPQDELSESETLAPRQLMVNPTFEVLRQVSTEKPLLAFCRCGHRLETAELTFTEAAVIDAVRESFRLSIDKLLLDVSGSQAHEAMLSLVNRGFLLCGRHGETH